MAKTGIWIDGKQAAGTLLELEKKVRQLNNEMKRLPVNSDAYSAKMKELKSHSGALTEHRNQIKGVGASFGQAKQGLGGLLKQFAPMAGVVGIATMAISGISTAISSWYNNNKEMEKSLSSLRSITGASVQDIEFYKQAAMDMGRESTYSAIQITEGFKLIGSARPELLKNKEALAEVTKETLTLAEAGQMELASSAQSMAGMMNQFNLEADQSSRIINTLAAGSKEGAAEINEVTDSIDKFGTVAAANNITIEESVGLTELLGEKNIKGSEAGTQLRNVLLNLSTASSLPKEALTAMAEYGVNLDVVQNKALPLQQRLQELSKVQGDQNALVKIFGKENVVAGQTVLGNLGRLDELTKAVTGTNVAYEQAAINTDNLDGDLKSLGSAWEGLTLSMDGGSSIFRPLVQAGTDMLNWTTDTITAFKEWDTNAMETSMLKLGKSVLENIPILDQLTGGLQDVMEEEIRLNELTGSVIKGMKDEADTAVVLTDGLGRYNQQLKSGKLTEEERNRVQGKQQEIVAELNKKYPDLTKNLDLNKISSKELSKLQKEINGNLVEQSLKAVEAAESERILTEIVANSIAISEQRNKESKRWFLTNAVADVFADSALDMQMNQNKLYKNLKDLPKTMKQVKKEVEAVAPEFGKAYKTNVDMVNDAQLHIERLEAKIRKSSGATKKALQADLKGQQEVRKRYLKEAESLEDKALKKEEAKIKADEVAAENAEKRAQAVEEANSKAKQRIEEARQKYKELQEQLKTLTDQIKKFKDEFSYEEKLKSFKDEQAKELFALEHTIEQKYEKEIESATLLSKQKGKLGIDGQTQLDVLLAFKEQDLAAHKLEINQKYEKQRLEASVAAADKEYELRLQHEESLGKAINEIRIAKAIAGVGAVAKWDFKGKKEAHEELKNATIAQADWELENERGKLVDLMDDKKISTKEGLLREQQLQEDHEQNVQRIKKESAEQQFKEGAEQAGKVSDKISEGLNAISQVLEAQTQIKLNRIETERLAEQTALESNFKAGLISKEEYEEKKRSIDEAAETKKKKIEYDAAVRGKEIAKAQALIGAAQAIIQSYAQLGPVGGSLAAVIIAVKTAAEIGVIDSQVIPQYEEGGFANVIGAKDGKMYKAKNIGRHRGGMTPSNPSLMLASEKGPEYFVPNHLLRDQRVVNSVRVIEAIRTNQYMDGGFTPGSIAGGSSNDEMMRLIKAQYVVLNMIAQKLPNIKAVISDRTIEDIDTRKSEINNFRG